MPSSQNNFKNLADIFFHGVQTYKSRTALLYKDPTGAYQAITWFEWLEKVKLTALGLKHFGVNPGDKIAILSENRPEWTFADLAILSLGAVTVPIYATLKSPDIHYILTNAEADIVFVSNYEQQAKIIEILPNLPRLKKIILFSSVSNPNEKTLTLSALLENGRRSPLSDEEFHQQCISRVNPSNIATLIYTSGTTGAPKGVILTHSNFMANIEGSKDYIPVSDADLALSFLPLSHVFERMAGYYYMLASGATIAYAESMQTVAEDMKIIKPTVAAAVPRFYEKIYSRIVEKAKLSPLRYRLFEWCVSVGAQMTKKRMEKERPSFLLKRSYAVAQALLFKKIKQGLGGRIRFFISGGAPLSKSLAEFFYNCGVLILEGYGLTETSPVIAANPYHRFRFGTVGQVLPNVQVKIAEDGEILAKGPSIMQGYYKNAQATQEVLQDGWFRTGDIGKIDADGFLSITDRKKDIIVTSGGKNISPQIIEGLILSDRLFLQMVVLGDRRNYLVALIVPNRSEMEAFAQSHQIAYVDYSDLLVSPRLYALVEERLNQKLGHLPNYEQIKYFDFCEKEFTIESGELTPTLKIKRRVIMERYAAKINALYEKGEEWQKKNPEFSKGRSHV